MTSNDSVSENIETQKRCSRCKKLKSRDEFSASGKKKDGKRSECKKCQREHHKHYLLHGPKQPNGIKIAKTIRQTDLKSRYGMTEADYISMLEDQGGVCAICGEAKKGRNQWGEYSSLCVDHSHTTGRVRGLLCIRCNFKLSIFENEVFSQKAIAYLQKYGQEA